MILALETATDVCGVALVHQQKVVASLIVSEKNVHSEKLLPMVDELLRKSSRGPEEIDAVAVSIGPGSFTGLRIGLSIAKGLADGWGKPIIAVPTLDALAYEYFRSHGGEPSAVVCPLIDAKRDEAYFAFYTVDAGGVHRRSEYAIASVSEIVASSPGNANPAFVGDGTRKLSPGMNPLLRVDPTVMCHPASVGLLAEKEGVMLSHEAFSTLEPLYIRDFIATQGKGIHAVSPRPASDTARIVQSLEG